MCIVYHERNRKQRGKILKRTFLLHQLKTWHAPSSTGEASKPIGCCGPQLYTVFHRGEHLQNFCGYLGPHLLARSHTQQTHPSVLQQVKWSTIGVPLEELQQAATIASDAFKDSEICFALFTEVFLYGCINASAAYTVLIYLEYASLSNWFEVALHFQDTANLTYTVHLFPIILNLAWYVIWCVLLHTYFTNLSQTLKNKRLYSAIFHAFPRKWGCIQVWGEVGALCVTMHMWKHNAYLCYLQKNARHMGSKIVYQLKV